MATPVEFDITIDDADGESEWLPLNRWASALMRLTTTVPDGTPTYSIVGTQKNILRDGVTTTADDEIPLNNFKDLTAGENLTQEVIFRALKLKVTSGTGSVRLRVQSEGYIA